MFSFCLLQAGGGWRGRFIIFRLSEGGVNRKGKLQPGTGFSGFEKCSALKARKEGLVQFKRDRLPHLSDPCVFHADLGRYRGLQPRPAVLLVLGGPEALGAGGRRAEQPPRCRPRCQQQTSGLAVAASGDRVPCGAQCVRIISLLLSGGKVKWNFFFF